MSKREYPYPFTAIVGQDDLKLGLILNVINPKIGGILAFGEKGTAKSTAVRAIAELLPEIPVVKGCRFRCNPNDTSILCEDCREKLECGEILETEYVKMRVVDLPVSATEDRVVGSLDIEEAIQKGRKKFEPGVLAEANRGILYVDEVNLLDDHIVDLLLDSAAMGVNTVEREGISFMHPAQFILVGTMNPEEGDLRPQLLDRFGLSVKIEGIKDPEKRVQIVKYRNAYDDDPKAFAERFAEKEKALSDKIENARALVKEVQVSDEILLTNAKIAIGLGVDGHRGDLTLMKAVKTYAAFENRTQADISAIEKVVHMVFLHRMKNLPFEQTKNFDMDMVRTIISGKTGDEE
ncbi:MAG: AAA domain-containing protein [Clostridiales bacterium]|nr:AAA domain-containing protein [Clostridiales bacterium]